jgi:HD-GYP domain-containing protein (c-di-GMP phosphodiesterase class II)
MARSTLRVEIRSGPLPANVWEIDTLVQVGRLPHLGMSLPDVSLSRLHAELLPRETGWVVCDLGSMNGTYLNGERVGRAEAKLRRGDTLQFGKVVLAITDIREQPLPGTGANLPLLDRSARLSWDTLPAYLTDVLRAEPAGADHIVQMLKIGRTCKTADSLKGYLNAILWSVAEAVNAPESSLFFFSDPNDLQPEMAVSLQEGSGPGPEAQRALLTLALRARRSMLLQLPSTTGGAPGAFVLYVLLRIEEQILGVLCLGRLPEQPPFTQADLFQADALALAASPSLRVFAEFFERQERLFLKMLTALTQLVHLRDDSSGKHCQRTTDYALMLAEQMGLSHEQKHYLRIGTPLHDVGKVGIRDEVLRKPGKLTAEEMSHARGQLLKGVELLEQIPSLSVLLPILRSAHEWWDGSGYPDGLAGTSIPLLARIVTVADTFDSMTIDQPYHPAFKVHQALEILQDRAGTQFDPACVSAFLQLRERLTHLVEQRREHTQTISMVELRRALAARDGQKSVELPAVSTRS